MEILRGSNFHFHYPIEWEQLSGKNKYQLAKWKVQAVNWSSGQTAMIWRAAVGGEVYKQDKIDALEVGPAFVVHYKLQIHRLFDFISTFMIYNYIIYLDCKLDGTQVIELIE